MLSIALLLLPILFSGYTSEKAANIIAGKTWVKYQYYVNDSCFAPRELRYYHFYSYGNKMVCLHPYVFISEKTPLGEERFSGTTCGAEFCDLRPIGKDKNSFKILNVSGMDRIESILTFVSDSVFSVASHFEKDSFVEKSYDLVEYYKKVPTPPQIRQMIK